jgi:outer membrane receptor protein involved in Fe transport
VYEAEVGWQPADAVSLVANVFDLTVKKPIVYSFTGLDAYANADRTASRGFEAELQLRHRGSSASISYAFYSAGGNRVPEYAVAGEPKLLAGFAGHKVIATARLRPVRRVVISPTLAWLSERAVFDGTEAPGEPAAGRIGPRAYVDLFASWQDAGGAKGLEIGIGVRDLLDEGTVHVQPYPGGHAPLPGNGREVWLRARYERGFRE